MAIQNFFTSRDNNLDGNTYVGSFGRLWYNPDTNSIYASDGVTVGGVPVDLATGANIVANNITVTTVTSTSGNIAITGNLIISGDISPATETKIGGVKAGPGANISADGLLTINTSGLPLSFGDFTANVNILTLVNEDQNMILATQGSAEVQLVGNIGFYKTDGFPPNIANRYFNATDDGQIRILVANVDATSGAVEIIGSTSGLTVPPVNTGVMLHITGQNNDASRFYNDGVGSFAAFVGRRLNGSVVSPTAVQAGDEIIRISSTGHNGEEIPGGAGARIVFQAIETYTPANNGSNLSFWTCAVGSNTLTKIATVDSANGVTATQLVSAGNAVVGNAIRYNIATNDAGNVAQDTSKSTPVTANGRSGRITMNAASLSQNSTVTFTVNNTYVTVNDVIVVSIQNPVTPNVYFAFVSRVANGSFDISIRNSSNGSLSDALVLNFAVIKVS